MQNKRYQSFFDALHHSLQFIRMSQAVSVYPYNGKENSYERHWRGSKAGQNNHDLGSTGFVMDEFNTEELSNFATIRP